jgi:hypothetical protein
MTNDIRTEPSDSFAGGRVRDEPVIRLPTLTRLMRALLPEDAVRHIQAARKEQLLALRAVLDTAIERIDSAEHSVRRTEIPIGIAESGDPGPSPASLRQGQRLI